jgi:hypothetical protein
VTQKSTTPASLTWSGATARRMARHALTEPATDRGPADIAGLMCGAHAQVLSAAELSIGRRIAGATREDVQRALWDDRTLVKTFGPRGTVHLLPTADLPMWTGALSTLPSSVPMHPEPVRFTPEQADELIVETARRSDLAGWAGYGYCASHSRFFWGCRSRLRSEPHAWRCASAS